MIGPTILLLLAFTPLVISFLVDDGFVWFLVAAFLVPLAAGMFIIAVLFTLIMV